MDLEDLLNPGERNENSHNDHKQSSPLISLRADLIIYKESIKDVSASLIDEGYTQYPIFIAHQHEVNVGQVILDKNELGTSWSIHASSLEEFIEKGLIQEERKDYFVKNFKPANEFMCLFVIVPQGANFVFYPY